MRTGNMTMEQALQAEKAVADRQAHRKTGYGLMKDRDKNWARLHPYYGAAREVIMEWGQDDTTLFALTIRPYKSHGGKPIRVVLDAEEVRKYLRWA